MSGRAVGKKCHIYPRGQRRTSRLIGDDRKTNFSNLEADRQKQQKTASSATPVSSNRKLRLQFALKTGKMLPGLTSLDFCFDLWM